MSAGFRSVTELAVCIALLCVCVSSAPGSPQAQTRQGEPAPPAPEDVVVDRRPETLRVVTYNVLVAFGNYKVGDPYHPGSERKQRIATWLASQEPDVVALQEMNGYTAEQLAEEATAWGHTHALMLKESGYPTALTSRWPIEVLDRVLDGMHHGVMRCRTGGVDYIVVHLWPYKEEDRRMHEVGEALRLAEQSHAAGRPVVILGDFNALSPQDLPMLSATGEQELARWRWDLEDPEVSYTDMFQAVADAGYRDANAGHWPDEMQMHEPRVDFVFLSPELADAVTDARWVYSPEMIRRSDHLPIVVDLDVLPLDATPSDD